VAQARRAEERRQTDSEGGGEREQVELPVVLQLAVAPPRLSPEEEQGHPEEATGETERRREIAMEPEQPLEQQREAAGDDADSAPDYGSRELESESV
jgi:hypothetical protein